MKSKPRNKTRKGILDFKNRTAVMGIVNITPDSFSDGNRFFDNKIAIKHALEMIQNGADIIDIGGESSRPGAKPVSVDEELKRTIPVISAIAGKTIISIDTVKAKVAEEALKAGANIINDISALNADPEMAGVAAKYKCPVILMHMLGSPQTMQANPAYKNLYREIISYLKQSIKKAVRAGVQRKNIIVDPGIGFGKTVEHNLQLIAEMRKLKSLGLPILSGPSRKSFIGKILDLPADQRMEGTAAAVVCSIMNGANIIRVHDVKEMVRIARITDAIRSMKYEKMNNEGRT
ncbi:MAG: dihydropteroate synthase [Planctomycetes bacterium]|nr:dihydropteroate synthase [Planctomycetota bacterium]